MDGTLYKSPNGDHYYLTVNGKIIADIDAHPLSSINVSKLSLKNCEAIERGYDLDELLNEREYQCFVSEMFNEGFKAGFQKALSILGDKKFSETELYRAFLINSAGDDFTLNQFFNRTVLPMFQQTQWDVEILMRMQYRHIDCVDVGEHVSSKIVKDNDLPMLDKDSCLILKRI